SCAVSGRNDGEAVRSLESSRDDGEHWVAGVDAGPGACGDGTARGGNRGRMGPGAIRGGDARGDPDRGTRTRAARDRTKSRARRKHEARDDLMSKVLELYRPANEVGRSAWGPAWVHLCNGLDPKRDGGMVPSILGMAGALAERWGPITIVTP